METACDTESGHGMSRTEEYACRKLKYDIAPFGMYGFVGPLSEYRYMRRSLVGMMCLRLSLVGRFFASSVGCRPALSPRPPTSKE